MRSLTTVAAGLLGLALVTPLSAQSNRVHKMQIFNGTTTTVKYFGTGISPRDRSALSELETAENEAAFVANLTDLKRQYVRNEGNLEATRNQMLRDLYSSAIIQNSPPLYGPTATAFTTFPGRRLFPTPFGAFPTAFGAFGPATGLVAGIGPFNAVALGAGGFGGFGGGAALLAESSTIKDAMASTIARQATAEYAMTVERMRDRALARAGSSSNLRAALGLPDANATPVAYEDTAPVVVTLKDGEKVMGTKLEEGKDWLTITTRGGGKTRVRASEVIRIDEGKGAATKPAAE
jgi:hypothetical protein